MTVSPESGALTARGSGLGFSPALGRPCRAGRAERWGSSSLQVINGLRTSPAEPQRASLVSSTAISLRPMDTQGSAERPLGSGTDRHEKHCVLPARAPGAGWGRGEEATDGEQGHHRRPEDGGLSASPGVHSEIRDCRQPRPRGLTLTLTLQSGTSFFKRPKLSPTSENPTDPG